MSAGEYVLAIDQGTSSSRAILFDRSGGVRAVAQREFTQHFPAPGLVEHDAEEIWDTLLAVAAEVVERAGVKPAEVAAIGITNQRETVVVWDRATGEPIHRALVWQDRRTAPECARLREEGAEAEIAARTGLVIDPYFSATKLAWILEHVPDARRRAEAGELAFGTIDSWLVHRLSEGAAHVTDASNASRTMLYDIHRGDWCPELLERFGVPRALLPKVVPSSGVCAEAKVEPFAGVPIAGLAGDQQAALFGQRCHAPGWAKNTYGTGCFLLMNTGTEAVPSKNRLLTTVAWERDGERTYALEGAVFTGGAVVQWLRDGLGIVESAAEIEALANSVPDSGGVVLVPALVGLGAPHWDPHARGTLQGITRGTSRGHLARAALEGIAFQVAELVDAMNADAGRELEELRVDGGAARNDLLLQIQADLLGRPVVRSGETESTALGAAFLAGRATGVWADDDALPTATEGEQRFEPLADRDEVAERRARWQRAVERSLAWEA